MPLDIIDQRILIILQENGRITNAELAKQIGMSPPPTLERVKKLEKQGFIKKYVALVNPGSVGIKNFVFVEVTLGRHGKEIVDNFIKEINKIEEVMECHHITGDADFLLKIAVRDISVYEELLLHKLTALPDIQHLKTLVVLSTMKNETGLQIQNL
ncbi:MAG: Lrp/AsnC ligand binding domain-containing protein [Prolixibacteraceae bacterium]|nr:Lrp/AsnC ligand binding domain-containing protein [Prolixibacteraceae bacterium]